LDSLFFLILFLNARMSLSTAFLDLLWGTIRQLIHWFFSAIST